MILTAICSVVMISAANASIHNKNMLPPEAVKLMTNLSSINKQESSPCVALLVEAANKAGVPGTVVYTYDFGDFDCVVQFRKSGPDLTLGDDCNNDNFLRLHRFTNVGVDLCSLQDLRETTPPVYSCEKTTFHGYSASFLKTGPPIYTEYVFRGYDFFWDKPKGDYHYVLGVNSCGDNGEAHLKTFTEALWSVAEARLPLSEVPVSGTEQPVQTVVPVTTVPGEVPGGDTPTVPVAPTEPGGLFGIPAAVILGSLGIPVAGAVAGAALSALLSGLSSGGVSTGNLLKTVVPTPQPPATASTIPEDSIATVTPEAQVPPQPPPVQTSPAPISADQPPLETATPPAAPVEGSIDPFKLGFNFLKDTVSAVGNISGVFNKYFAGSDTAETVSLIRNAVNTWHDAPSVQSATNYLENLGKSNALREPAISKTLGIVGKGLDVVEAGINASKICAERGYSGLDAILTTYAKVGEKAVVWGLTKNPVVALADAAVGGATTLIFGAKNKVDIGVLVGKADYAWDNVTRHAADRFNRSFETAAASEKTENLKYITERIRQQVEDGKVSQKEGSRRLQRVLDKFNQDSPIL